MAQEKIDQINALKEQGGEDAIKQIQEIKEEAEAGFEGDVAGAAEKAIAELIGAGNKAAEEMKTEADNTVVKAEAMGGNKDDVENISTLIEKEAEVVVDAGKEEIREVEDGDVEKVEKSPDPVEQKESIDGEFNKKYNTVLDKMAPLEQKLNELKQKEKDLAEERRELDKTGNEQRKKEIEEEFIKIEDEKSKHRSGEKIYNLFQQRDKLWETRSSIKAEKYDYYTEREKYDDREKRLKESEEKEKELNGMIHKQAQDENWEENGLDGMNREGERIRTEFKKELGYDKDFAIESKNKLDYIGARDANRIVINNYLGLELPIFSKEFKLKDIGEGRVGNKFDFIQDNSSDGKYNKNLLAQKQLALWEKVTEARETLSKLSKEDKSKLAQENQLIFSALKNVSGSPNKPLEDNLSDVFMPMAGVGKAMYLDSTEDYNLFPDKGVKVENETLSPYDFAIQRYHDSSFMMNALILQKLAKEKGLIKE